MSIMEIWEGLLPATGKNYLPHWAIGFTARALIGLKRCHNLWAFVFGINHMQNFDLLPIATLGPANFDDQD